MLCVLEIFLDYLEFNINICKLPVINTSKLSPSTCLGLCCFLKIILDFNITDLLSVINFSNCTRVFGLLSKKSVSELYRNPTLMSQTHILKPLKVNPKSVDILKI